MHHHHRHQHQPFLSSVYPDPRIEVLSEKFTFKLANAAVEKIADGFRWAEGPVYLGDQRCLLFSDIPNNRIMRWLEETQETSVFRHPANNANGNTRDKQGRLITCEHLTRRITRTEYSGSITLLADSYSGKKLNAPNDIIVDSADRVWFSDPGYGIDSDYEGNAAAAELPRNVYCYDTHTKRLTVATSDLVRPNGLALSPDERQLYVVNSAVQDEGEAQICVFDVDEEKLTNGRVLVDDFSPGTTDGIKIDRTGNIWCSMGWSDEAENGVRCYTPEGELIGKIHLPEPCGNLCFGGEKKNRLFMTASTSVYAVYLNTCGF
jgi:gluconolactonase